MQFLINGMQVNRLFFQKERNKFFSSTINGWSTIYRRGLYHSFHGYFQNEWSRI